MRNKKLIMRDALILWLAAFVLVVGVGFTTGGCSGLIANPTYSAIIDKAAILSAVDANHATTGLMTPQEMVQTLQQQAVTFQRLRDAKDGKAGAQ